MAFYTAMIAVRFVKVTAVINVQLRFVGTKKLRLSYVLDCGAGAIVAEDCSGGIDAGAIV